jgi:hypothetical protein
MSSPIVTESPHLSQTPAQPSPNNVTSSTAGQGGGDEEGEEGDEDMMDIKTIRGFAE